MRFSISSRNFGKTKIIIERGAVNPQSYRIQSDLLSMTEVSRSCLSWYFCNRSWSQSQKHSLTLLYLQALFNITQMYWSCFGSVINLVSSKPTQLYRDEILRLNSSGYMLTHMCIGELGQHRFSCWLVAILRQVTTRSTLFDNTYNSMYVENFV